MVRVDSERQEDSAALRGSMTARSPRGKVAHGGEHLARVGQGDLEHAGGGAEGGERLAGAEHVNQPAAYDAVGVGLRGGDDAALVG